MSNTERELLWRERVARWRKSGLNRRIASYDSVGKFGAWDYDGDGNVLSETDANGNSTTHDYNELGQRTTTRQPEGRTLTFDADLMGNRTGLTDGRGNKTSYEYDRLNVSVQPFHL
ncbi:RHS repeat domain-containing protein [Duganella sp. Root198D2]|uniref:RHS repeat domain-containing protein n=1 Tax=Duganella sp. Root198D2 TaxID=1736489 RepID=UPI0007089868|nr:RHS repeat domain-containing protein [Duganella sp. Root198D2]KRB87473.1 hypothetical protein ASE26_29445 [Duganella sp. Root198D2]